MPEALFCDAPVGRGRRQPVEDGGQRDAGGEPERLAGGVDEIEPAARTAGGSSSGGSGRILNTAWPGRVVVLGGHGKAPFYVRRVQSAIL